MSEDEHTDASPPEDDPEDDGSRDEARADDSSLDDDSGEGGAADTSQSEDDPGADESEDEAAALRAELDALRDELEAVERDVDDVETEFDDFEDQVEDFEDDVEERTVHRDEIERDLKRYVRKRVRRGHARDWGPYLVLLYGTAMTLGVFYFFQNSAGYAILAMIIIWLSTLGLYALMLIVGVAFNVLGLPGRARDAVGGLRNRF